MQNGVRLPARNLSGLVRWHIETDGWRRKHERVRRGLGGHGNSALQPLNRTLAAERDHDIEHAGSYRLARQRGPRSVDQQSRLHALLLRVGSQNGFRGIVCEAVDQSESISEPGQKVLQAFILQVLLYRVGF